MLRNASVVRNWSGGIRRPRFVDVLHNFPSPEWRVLLRHHPNVLLEGRESDFEATLVALRTDFFPRVCDLVYGLPATRVVDGGVTVIVREIAAFDAEQCAALSQWLDEAPGPLQVVSTSSIPVFPLVERRLFPSDLYYRLNGVLLTLP